VSQDTDEDLQSAGNPASAAYHDESDWDEDPVLEIETSVRFRPHTMGFSGGRGHTHPDGRVQVEVLPATTFSEFSPMSAWEAHSLSLDCHADLLAELLEADCAGVVRGE
jgi:hypothetical protein